MMRKLFLTFIFVFCIDANAWWDTGHRLVCDEAYKVLTMDAKKAEEPLMKEHESFDTALIGASGIKNKERKDTRWRVYINMQD